jgi:anthranilate phosphoribosyltransferase
VIQASIAKLSQRKALTFDEARESVEEILKGLATPSQIAGFLMALKMKGETTDEIAGAVTAMRAAATPIKAASSVVVDTCGTGGDGQKTFNVSTAAALVVAGAGFTVAKHGNRSISSQCGSADVLEALGVKIDPTPEVAKKCLDEAGIAFLFAPLYHPALKYAMPTRKELAVRTVFNILGPLCNPAGANAQVIGVYDAALVDVAAKVLKRVGAKNAWVVHASGHDEITLSAETIVGEISGGAYKKRKIGPKDFGFKKHPASTLAGLDKNANADRIREILAGEKSPRRDVVVANAAAAIFVAHRAAGKKEARSLREAREIAEASIDGGHARSALDKLVRLSHSGL